jgi:hypothetical protein
MNINNLGKATDLKNQLTKLREQIRIGSGAGVSVIPRGYSAGYSLPVSTATLAAVTTLVSADLAAQEKALLAQLNALGVVEQDFASGGETKSFHDGGIIGNKEAFIASLAASAILGDLAGRRNGRHS